MLAIDAGNTHITVGFFEEGELKDIFRIPTETCIRSSSFLEYLPEGLRRASSGAVISSVRAEATEIIRQELSAFIGENPLVVNDRTPMGIKISYDTRETLGMDRIVAAAAAHHLYRVAGRDLIIIDMGTATTIDYVTGEGVFIGGMIAPGLRSSYQGLLEAAPQLPLVETLSETAIIGKSTVDCIKAGVVTGHAAMIRGAVEMMAEERSSRVAVILTGGLSILVKDILPPDYTTDEHLILRGLSYIYSLHNENNC